MSKDIEETTDVAKDHPEVVERLSATLEAIRESGRSADPRL